MKYIWEEQDITVGTVYGRAGMDEKWMIGYLSFVDDPIIYVSISLLDGMVTQAGTKSDLVSDINSGNYIPLGRVSNE